MVNLEVGYAAANVMLVSWYATTVEGGTDVSNSLANVPSSQISPTRRGGPYILAESHSMNSGV